MRTIFKLLPILLATILSSCGSANNTSSPSSIMINDFENESQLYLMKFPYPTHSDRGKFELSTEHVTSGNKSTKFSNEYGNVFEMHHYFDHIVGGSIDIKNIKNIQIDIYNASKFDTTAKLVIYNNEGLDLLLEKEFDIFKGMNNHLTFELSKIALENNYSTIISTSLIIYTSETDFDKGIGYTFYIDNWHAEMGSVMTEEDLANKELIDEVQEKISALPEPAYISESNYDALNEIALQIGHISSLYRRIISNLALYRKIVDSYYSKYQAAYVPSANKTTFLPFGEFMGMSAINSYLGSKVATYFSDEWKINPDDKGSTMMEFSGTLHNMLTINPLVSLKSYDFVTFTVKNCTENYVRIWLCYSTLSYFDLNPGETVTAQFKTSDIISQSYWVIDHIKVNSMGTVVPASGYILFGESYVTSISEDALGSDMLYAFNSLPAVTSVNTEDDYAKVLGLTATARSLYETLSEKYTSQVSNERLNLLKNLETKVSEAGYINAYNSYYFGMSKYYYGQEIANVIQNRDSTYGFASKAPITKNTYNGDKTGYEQCLTFENDVTDISKEGYVMYVYNPTNTTVDLHVRCTGWEWAEYEQYFTNVQCMPKSWTKLEINSILFSSEASYDNKIAIYLSCSISASNSLIGDWLFSSLIGVPTAK